MESEDNRLLKETNPEQNYLPGYLPQHRKAGTKKYEDTYGSNHALHTKIVDQYGNPFQKIPVDVAFPAKQNVSVADALPAGSNIIGTVKLSDGSNALVVDENGRIGYVPYDSGGSELFTDGNPGATQLTGSNMEQYGATINERPSPSTVPIGSIYMAVQTQDAWQSDGANWVVI